MTEYKIERVKSGIPGLDELMEGGFTKGDAILIAGKAGTGKSIFGCQFLYAGATKYNEHGVLVTLEEPPEKIKRNMMRFNMDLEKLEKEGKLVILNLSPLKSDLPIQIADYPSFDLSGLRILIANAIKKVNAKRVVIDSISLLAYRYQNKAILRAELFKLAAAITEMGCTLLLISEVPEDSSSFGVFDVERYLASGVVVLYNEKVSETNRTRLIEILKMRGSNHSLRIHSMRITNEGIHVFPAQAIVK